ncbi:MAG: protein adenylyltransferase SelO [Ilumatobacter sp.]
MTTPIAFDNSFVRDLPGMYERWEAATAPVPQLLALNEGLACDLGIDADWLRSAEGVDVLVGNTVPDGAEPVAQDYAGHQFGGYSPRLGDGRALLLGEVVGPSGDRHDLHLKGSGRTPFARGGDGLAAVGPMLREYLMCEAMHALGIPTTRALAVVATGESVRRDTMLPGAVFVRVASSHLRVGSFQYAASLDDPGVLAALLDHAIARHHQGAADAEVPALAFLDAVMEAQAELIARWMNVGFVHGVMNTDNVTISGETIDFGPCAFMDVYDPTTVFSSIDHGGRYAYGNQPSIGQWNLARLAEPLLPLIDTDVDAAVERATDLLRTFPDRYRHHLVSGQAAKLGLDADRTDVGGLAGDLLALMQSRSADFTLTWRSLSDVVRGDADPFHERVGGDEEATDWLDRFRAAHAGSDGSARPDVAAAIDAANPLHVPRNHLVEAALSAGAEGDLSPFEELMDVLADPVTERPGLERFSEPAPDAFAAGYQTFCGT